ncbi:MAG TPA: maleylpyruvate isomerase family mycothiol-dependent enzyme [Streptosporangiaceae bacterium]
MSRRETVLLAEAVRYMLGRAASVGRRELAASTPCPGWNLDALLRHLAESIEILDTAITGTPPPARPDCAVTCPGTCAGTTDPVELLRDRAAGLLWTAFTAEDRTGCAVPVIAVGAIEITVHGWDVSAACASPAPIPPQLAAPLLAHSFRLVPARDGLFGPPVPVPSRASPGDRLLAWLGRDPATSYRRVA